MVVHEDSRKVVPGILIITDHLFLIFIVSLIFLCQKLFSLVSIVIYFSVNEPSYKSFP